MEKGRSLQSLLRDNSVTADDFFQSQGISAQVRSNLSRFVKYCRTHRTFAVRMIYLALNVSYAELENPKIKTATFAINELLANEQSELADLFFDNRKKPEADSTEIPEELQEGIQSEAERLFRFDSDEEQTLPPEEPKPEQITGVELIELSLQILKNPQKNETCLGHLQKMYSFFIRHDPIPVLAYLDEHPQVIRLLLTNLRYSSISSLLAQLLTSQDKNKEYKYQTLKKNLLVQAIEQIFARLSDEDYFDGALILLEEILNTTKQSYYQYFQDFKRISNYLVSAEVLGRFYDELLKLHELSFGCISRFLESLFSRLNSESDEKDHYYQKEQSSPSMNFETEIFVKNVSTLLLLVPQIASFNSLTKINYLSFLETFLSSVQVKASPPSLNDPAFLSLFTSYKNEKTGGIVKSKIYSIINGILSRVSLQQIKEFVQLHPSLFLQYFQVIRAANYSNTKTYNRNENAAFDVSLISQLTRKDEEALNNVSQILGKNFKRICKKYDTKIASFQNSSSFSLEEESNFYQYNSEANGISKQNGEGVLTGFSLNFVGKNNISIPILQLPEKSNANSPENNEGKEDLREERIARTTDYLKEVIEVQQVIVLTQKLDSFTKCNGIGRVDNHYEQVKFEIKEEKNAKVQQQNIAIVQQKTNQAKHQDLKNAKPKTNEKPIALPKKQSQKVDKVVPQISGEQDRARFYTRHLTIFA